MQMNQRELKWTRFWEENDKEMTLKNGSHSKTPLVCHLFTAFEVLKNLAEFLERTRESFGAENNMLVSYQCGANFN